MHQPRIWTTLNLGALPVDLILACLQIKLSPGDLLFSADAQEHAFKEQPHREPICRPHLANVVAAPTHIGQQPKYVGKAFDLVHRVGDDGPIILIAVGLRPYRKSGLYGVHSVYPIDESTLNRRVRVKTCTPI
jgi:hypothetical protein